MKTLLAIGIALVVLVVGYFLFARTAAEAPTPQATTATTTVDASQPAPAPATVSAGAEADTGIAAPGDVSAKKSVSYNGTSFSPASVTIKKGDSVTFTNNSSGDMWVASNPHPTHQGYSGTSVSAHCPDTSGTAFDECTAVPAGGTYTFTFEKVGSWGYHNHLNHNVAGTVVVTQ